MPSVFCPNRFVKAIARYNCAATFFNQRGVAPSRRGVSRLVRNAFMKTVFLKPMVARHHYKPCIGQNILETSTVSASYSTIYCSKQDFFSIVLVDLNCLPSDCICSSMAGSWIPLCLVVAIGMVPWLNGNCLAASRHAL